VNIPNILHSAFRKHVPENRKSRFYGIFRNWHGACNPSGIRRNGPPDGSNGKGNFEMSALSQLPARFTAAVSALALSLVLISGTVSVPTTAQAQTSGTYVGVVA
jgi:hypothetical protein